MNPNTPTPQSTSTGATATKHFLTSKTIVGLLLIAVSWLNNRFNLGLTGEENAQTTEDIVTMLGLGLGIWGRFSAKKTLAATTDNVPRLWMLVCLLCFVLPLALTACTFSAAYLLPNGNEVRAKVGDGRASVGGKYRPGDGKETIEADLELALPSRSGLAK